MTRLLPVLLSLSLVFGAAHAGAATKTTAHKWANLNAAQRAKLTEQARLACRKQFGAMSTLYRIDYYTTKIWCREN